MKLDQGITFAGLDLEYLGALEQFKHFPERSRELFPKLIERVSPESRGRAAAFFAKEAKLPLSAMADRFLLEGSSPACSFLGFAILDPNCTTMSVEPAPFSPAEIRKIHSLTRKSLIGAARLSAIRKQPAKPQNTLAMIQPADIFLSPENSLRLGKVDLGHNVLAADCSWATIQLQRTARRNFYRFFRKNHDFEALEEMQRIWRNLDVLRTQFHLEIFTNAMDPNFPELNFRKIEIELAGLRRAIRFLGRDLWPDQ